MTDLLVLRRGTHGMPVESYVAELRERLPDHDIELARTPAAERDAIADAPVVTGPDIPESLLDGADSLELFAGMYAGYGHLPLDALEARDVAVTTASGVHAPNVAEHVLASILAFVREFPTAFDRQRDAEWRHFQAHELAESTVTVVGLGAIGEGVVDRLQGFDVETVGVRHSPEKGGPTDEVLGPDGLHGALARTDYLVLACPLTDETRGLLDAEAFHTLPPEAVVVNVARGPVVDTDALVEALRSNRIRGAALDVTDPEPLPQDHPLWTLSNVLVTPHNAGHTPRYYERLADIVAENVRRIDDTGRYEGLRNQVR
ncbi:D-2-hydroxyacid dehydrogenase [Halomarina oriensis]|uniref:D-2-hydroxyacid dehydrogenase n=1 Tax=Halomarina oriensis TaxID=671145 RepID=A0A6B0GPT1_9EURY|nr:D-2-hydroxyacid dehydrogenase [Halomarina oriensis]MWG36031.1 D-2-hydroxyacid dehydrogenase [Halomarina oriensis]